MSGVASPVDNLLAKKPVAYKTTMCKHFARSNGWCPRGDNCDFIHDTALLTAQAKEKENAKISAAPESIDSGSKKGALGHCWGHVQGTCKNRRCRYLHPRDVKPFLPFTPCPEWARCTKGSSCPFKHPEGQRPAFAPQINASIPFAAPTAPVATTAVPFERNGTLCSPRSMVLHGQSKPLASHNPVQSNVNGDAAVGAINFTNPWDRTFVPGPPPPSPSCAPDVIMPHETGGFEMPAGDLMYRRASADACLTIPRRHSDAQRFKVQVDKGPEVEQRRSVWSLQYPSSALLKNPRKHSWAP